MKGLSDLLFVVWIAAGAFATYLEKVYDPLDWVAWLISGLAFFGGWAAALTKDFTDF